MKNKTKARLKYIHIDPLLVSGGKVCVFTNVCNVYTSDLAMLKKPTNKSDQSYANRIIASWNMYRSIVSNIPPSSWPLTIMIWISMSTMIMVLVMNGYK